MDRPLPAYDGEHPYVFLSYSHEDANLVYPELRWLQDQGFNIWWDEGISPGATWRNELVQALHGCSLILYFITPNSVESEQCIREINFGLDEYHCPVLAIHLVETTLPDALGLSLSDRQAILRHELASEDYERKVISAISAYLEQPIPSGASPRSRHRNRLAQVSLLGLVVVIALAIAIWEIDFGEQVVVLMDTPAEHGVYDKDTLEHSGTNADDLTLLLRELPVILHKESLGSTWDREHQVAQLNPDLVMIHRSAFFHSMNAEFGFGYSPFADDGTAGALNEDRWNLLYKVADSKLIAFFGYIGQLNRDTKFLIYSRGTGGGWPDEKYRMRWVEDVEGRFPLLEDRIFTMHVKGGLGNASFKVPATATETRKRVRKIIGLAPATGEQGES